MLFGQPVGPPPGVVAPQVQAPAQTAFLFGQPVQPPSQPAMLFGQPVAQPAAVAPPVSPQVSSPTFGGPGRLSTRFGASANSSPSTAQEAPAPIFGQQQVFGQKQVFGQPQQITPPSTALADQSAFGSSGSGFGASTRVFGSARNTFGGGSSGSGGGPGSFGGASTGTVTPPTASPAAFQRSVTPEAVMAVEPPRRTPSPITAAGTSWGGGGAGGMDDEEGEDALVIVGTCEYMCPVEERQRREECAELHPLERVDPDNPKLTNEHLIVKRAVRNYDAKDRQPEQFRTLRALTTTMNHLRSIMDWTPEVNRAATPVSVHGFLWDRYREIRKELVTQRFHVNPATLPQVVAWNEEICRYMLICSHELVGEEHFPAMLNQEQMNKCLMDLRGFYETAVNNGIDCPNSAEFKCYLVIMTFAGLVNKHNNKIPNKQAALEMLRSFTDAEQATPWYRIMLAVLRVLSLTDVRGFWNLMKASPYVLACVLYTQSNMVTQHGMALAAKAYDGSLDPNNIVPVSAVTPFMDVGPKAIASKAKYLPKPAEVQGQGAATEFRFASLDVDNYRPNVVTSGKKLPLPPITRKRPPVGQLHTAAALPPTISEELLALVDRMSGRAPGSTPMPTPTQTAAVVGAGASLSAASGAFGQPSSSVSGAVFGMRASPAAPAAPSTLRAQAAAVFGSVQPSMAAAGAPIDKKQLRQQRFGGSAATLQSEQQLAAGPSTSRVLHSSTVPNLQSGQQAAPPSTFPAPQSSFAEASQTGRQQKRAAEVDTAVMAAAQEQVAQAEARAAAAMSQVQEERRAREAAERQMVQQQQMLSQQAMHVAQQTQLEAEHYRQQALHEAEQLRQQLALQAQQMQVMAAEREAIQKELTKKELHEKEKQLREALQRLRQRRVVQLWRDATQQAKEREAHIRQQMARCRIDKVAHGTVSSIPLPASPTPPPAPAVSTPAKTPAQQPANGTLSASKRPCRRVEGTDLETAIARLAYDPVLQHLPLEDILAPVLLKALLAAGWKQPDSSSHASVTASYGPQGSFQKQQDAVLWKLVVCTGTLETSEHSHPNNTAQLQHATVGQLQSEAALWLRASLSAGRSRAAYQPPTGNLLTLLPTTGKSRQSMGLSTGPKMVLCVEEMSAAAVAAEPIVLPEHSSSSMSATSALLLLVSGPAEGAVAQLSQLSTPTKPPASKQLLLLAPSLNYTNGHTPDGAGSPGSPSRTRAGGGCLTNHGMNGSSQPVHVEGLNAATSTSLSQSWQQLRQLLEAVSPHAHIPVVILALTDAAGITAVHSHFRATANQWPTSVTSRMSSCQILPLLPDQNALVALNQALVYLACHPPTPFLIAAGCADSTPASGPNSPRWAAAPSAAEAVKITGAPKRCSLEGLVKQVVELCLAQCQPSLLTPLLPSVEEQGAPWNAQNVLAELNKQLDALSRGVHATANHVLARWGVPAPELTPPDACAPHCWQPSHVQHCMDLILQARVPVSAVSFGSTGTGTLAAYQQVARLLHAYHERWVQAHFTQGPVWCYLLPRYLPGAASPVLNTCTSLAPFSSGSMSAGAYTASSGGYAGHVGHHGFSSLGRRSSLDGLTPFSLSRPRLLEQDDL